MEQAIEFEAQRQIEVLEAGGRSCRRRDYLIPTKVRLGRCASKRTLTIIVFPDLTCCPLIVSEDMIRRVLESMPKSKRRQRQEFIEHHGFHLDWLIH